MLLTLPQVGEIRDDQDHVARIASAPCADATVLVAKNMMHERMDDGNLSNSCSSWCFSICVSGSAFVIKMPSKRNIRIGNVSGA